MPTLPQQHAQPSQRTAYVTNVPAWRMLSGLPPNATSATMAIGGCMTPIYVPSDMEVRSLLIRNGSGVAGSIELALFSYRKRTRIASGGVTPQSGINVWQSCSTNVRLRPGWYWIGAAFSSLSATALALNPGTVAGDHLLCGAIVNVTGPAFLLEPSNPVPAISNASVRLPILAIGGV